MWGLALIRIDRAPPWIFSLRELILNSQKKKRLQRHLGASCQWHIWGRIHFTWPRVKCLRRISSSPNSRGLCGASSCKVYSRHTVPILYPVTLSYGGGQMGNPCLTSTEMPRWSDSSQTEKKWNKSIVASLYGEDPTAAQHDNDHKSTQALRLPPERRFFKWMWVSMID